MDDTKHYLYSRKQIMQMYDISKWTILKMEKEGKLKPYSYNLEGRKTYYDIREVNKLFFEIEPVK
jgi:hypothetical protein